MTGLVQPVPDTRSPLGHLTDRASPETRAEGERLIAAELAQMPDSPRKKELEDRLRRIREAGERNLYF